MQILWLSTSNDINPRIPEDQRAPAVAKRRLEQATGLSFDVEVRKMWPTPDLPPRVDRWLDRYEPDIVFIIVPSYWNTWESLHRKFQRRVPLLGRLLAAAGDKASGTPWLSENSVYRALRRSDLRVLGGEPLFTSKEVSHRMEEVIRLVLAREETVVAVRGPTNPNDSTISAAGFARAERRRKLLHRSLKQLCEELHVSYVGWDEPLYLDANADHVVGDAIHIDTATHVAEGEQWGDVLAEAWSAAHPEA